MPASFGTTPHDRGRILRVAVVAGLDVVWVVVAYFLALLLRFDFLWSQIPPEYVQGCFTLLPGTCLLVVGFFWIFRLYHSIWSFASVVELMRAIYAWMATAVSTLIVATAMGIHMPASYWFVGSLLGFLFPLECGSRIVCCDAFEQSIATSIALG